MQSYQNKKSYLFIIGCIFLGSIFGLIVGIQPILVIVAFVGIGSLALFFTNFEKTVVGLLIIRSSLDLFSDYQIPALFAVGVIGLTLFYIIIQILTRKKVQTDGFWWFLAGWVALQGLWVILLPLGGLGFDGNYLFDAIREWVRLFSWLIIYLLVMQLKGKISPEKMVDLLFFGLIIPLGVACIQMIVPPSFLPDFLVYESNVFEANSRLNATFGHPNTFTTFLLFFLGLTYWKQNYSQKRNVWIVLLGTIVFFLVSTKALVGLIMFFVLMTFLTIPRLSLLNLIFTIVLTFGVIFLFASTEYGRERLGSLGETPLINPDINIWTAILTSKWDGNSFNWRLVHWHYLLQQWQDYPILGYGLGLNKFVSVNGLEPHNDYLRALVERGILGLSTFIVLILAQFIRLVQLMKSSFNSPMQKNFYFTLCGILTALSIGMITENIWTHTTLFFYWWTLLAIAGWNWQKSADIHPE